MSQRRAMGKPPFNGGLVDPKWNPLWESMQFFVPFWDYPSNLVQAGGRPMEWFSKAHATPSSATICPSSRGSLYGNAGDFANPGAANVANSGRSWTWSGIGGNLNIDDNFTLLMVIQPNHTATDKNGSIFKCGNFSLGYEPDDHKFAYTVDLGTIRSSAISTASDKPHTVALFSRKSPGNVRLLLFDGQAVMLSTGAYGTPVSGTFINIGGGAETGQKSKFAFDGRILSLTFHNVELTAELVRAWGLDPFGFYPQPLWFRGTQGCLSGDPYFGSMFGKAGADLGEYAAGDAQMDNYLTGEGSTATWLEGDARLDNYVEAKTGVCTDE